MYIYKIQLQEWSFQASRKHAVIFLPPSYIKQPQYSKNIHTAKKIMKSS